MAGCMQNEWKLNRKFGIDNGSLLVSLHRLYSSLTPWMGY